MRLKRLGDGPIIGPDPLNDWESNATYNPAAFREPGTRRFHLLYRAVGDYEGYVGRLGHAVVEYDPQRGEIDLCLREAEPVFSPEHLRDRGVLQELGLEETPISTEDARITPVTVNGETRLWMTVVIIIDPCAPEVIRRREGGGLEDREPQWQACTMLTEIDLDGDRILFSNDPGDYNIITPPDLSDKDVVPFPEPVDGEFMFLDRRVPLGREESHVGENRPCTKIASLNVDTMQLEEPRVLLPVRTGSRWESVKNGAGLPPIRTDRGWLLVYHGVDEQNVYRTGAAVADLQDPTDVLWRSEEPILEPLRSYEQEGDVPNVTFATGGDIVDGRLVVFYGCADKFVGAAVANMADMPGM